MLRWSHIYSSRVRASGATDSDADLAQQQWRNSSTMRALCWPTSLVDFRYAPACVDFLVHPLTAIAFPPRRLCNVMARGWLEWGTHWYLAKGEWRRCWFVSLASSLLCYKYIRLRGLVVYPHMPILRPHAARHSTSGQCIAWILRRRMSKLTFTSGGCARMCPARTPIRPILSFWEAKFTKKCDIPCPERRWTTVQNLTPLALSSVEKSVTVQNDKITNKQTNKQ